MCLGDLLRTLTPDSGEGVDEPSWHLVATDERRFRITEQIVVLLGVDADGKRRLLKGLSVWIENCKNAMPGGLFTRLV